VNFRHAGAVRTKTYGVDAAFMQLKRHERGIHALCREPERGGGLGSPVTVISPNETVPDSKGISGWDIRGEARDASGGGTGFLPLLADRPRLVGWGSTRSKSFLV